MKKTENRSYAELKNQVILTVSQNDDLKKENTLLKEQLEWFKKQIFGKKI